MLLPAYLFLYDENGMLVQGECMMPVILTRHFRTAFVS